MSRGKNPAPAIESSGLSDEKLDTAIGSSAGVVTDAREPGDVPLIPDQIYFRIGDVARIVGVQPYVLRYWESEFKRDIRPERSASNQRLYRRHDVELFLEIKRLRYEEKLELPGARRRLREGALTVVSIEPEAPRPHAEPAMGEPAHVERVRAELKKGLEELLRMVDFDERLE